jgi:uncharacterized repeat protein (TIGR03803 family)
MIYGSTPIGGTNGTGTVYSLTTNGANFRVVRSFPASGATESGPPLRALLCSAGTIFGTTTVGGTNLTGTIFSLNTNGTGFAVIYNFSTNVSNTNFDGADPEGALILAGDTLYGTASAGGTHGNGTVFSINTNGSAFSTLWSFSKLNSATNVDGAGPRTGVVLGGAYLYGTGYYGGVNDNGTVFSLGVAPVISSLTLSGTNAILNGLNVIAGRAYTVLTSTDASLPVGLWNPVATNTFAGGGAFSVTATNAIVRDASEQFFLLETQ